MVRILYYTDLFIPFIGGNESYLANVESRINFQGHRTLHITSRIQDTPKEEIKKWDGKDIPIQRTWIPFKNDFLGKGRYFFPLNYRKAAKIARDFDIIHATTFIAGLTGWRVGKITKKPVVLFCCPSSTPIFTRNQIKPISKIKKGDFVLTHKGRFRKVTETFQRYHSGDIIRIKPKNLPEIQFTPNHNILGIKAKRCKYNKKGRCKPNCNEITNPKRNGCKFSFFKNYKLEWIPSKELKKGDFVVIPRTKLISDVKYIHLSENQNIKKVIINKVTKKTINNQIPLEKDFLRLIGYYLAEGYSGKDRITWTFHNNEITYMNDVKYLIKRYFDLNAKIVDHKKYGSNASSIEIYSSFLPLFFKRYFGDNRYNKNFPMWFLFLPEEKIIELIKGMWRGDGRINKDMATYTSVSKLLIYGLFQLMIKIGLCPHIYEYKKGSKNENIIELFVTGKPLQKLNQILDFNIILKNQKKKSMTTWIDNNFIYFPIQSIKQEEFNDFVYNLEVEEDNSYAPFFAVHNCHELFRNLWQEIGENWIQKNIYPIIEKYMTSKYNHLATCSEYGKKTMIDAGADPDKITIINHGVNDMFNPNVDGSGLRKQLGLENNQVFGFTGRLKIKGTGQSKGLPYLLKATKEVFKELPESRLVLGGTDFDALKPLIKELDIEDKVIYAGVRPYQDVPKFHAMCDVMVGASIAEGFGIYYAEASACGKAIVATTGGAIPEIIKHKETGLLSEPKDYEAMAQNIIKLLTDKELRDKYGKAGSEYVKKFNWDRSAKEHLELYKSILSQY